MASKGKKFSDYVFFGKNPVAMGARWGIWLDRTPNPTVEVRIFGIALIICPRG